MARPKNEDQADEVAAAVNTVVADREARNATEKALRARPKVRVRIPLPPGMSREDAKALDKPPAVPVGVNGYFYNVPKGYDVEVPDVVADLLALGGHI